MSIYVKPEWGGVDIYRRHISAIEKLRAKDQLRARVPKKINEKKESILAELEAVERAQIMSELSQVPPPAIILVGTPVGIDNLLQKNGESLLIYLIFTWKNLNSKKFGLNIEKGSLLANLEFLNTSGSL